MDHNNGELDRILDEGLATYSTGEPLPGLEERVLSRVAVARAAKRRTMWRWALVALPAAACLLLAVSVIWRRQEVQPVRRANGHAQVQPDPVRPESPPAIPVERHAVRTKKMARPAVAQIAKREQFPTPDPLSREERALVSLAMAAPAEPPVAFGEPAAIQVEPIQIEPLDIGGQSEEKFQ